MNRALIIVVVLGAVLAGCASRPGIRALSVQEQEDVTTIINLFSPTDIENRARDVMSTEFIKKMLVKKDLPDTQMRIAVQALEDVLMPKFRSAMQESFKEAFITEMDRQSLADTRIWLQTGSGKSFAAFMRMTIVALLETMDFAQGSQEKNRQQARKSGLKYAETLSDRQRMMLATYFQSRAGQQFRKSLDLIDPVLQKRWERIVEKENLAKEFLLRFQHLLSEQGLLEDQG